MKPAVLYLLSFMLFQFLTCAPGRTENGGQQSQLVRWDMLNLNPDQSSEIQRIESSWKKTYGDIHPQIQRDREQLRQLLHDPQAKEQDVMEFRARINRNEERLHNEATWAFLCKKKVLNEQQRQHLKQLME